MCLFVYFQEELETLKAKLEKLENERTTLKHENDKLEAKVSKYKYPFPVAFCNVVSNLEPVSKSFLILRGTFVLIYYQRTE